MKTIPALILIASAFALFGCAPQVVYVPQPNQSINVDAAPARKARNEECAKMMAGKIYLTDEMNTALSGCERHVSQQSDACRRFIALIATDDQMGITRGATSCIDEMNIGGIGISDFEKHVKTAASIANRMNPVLEKLGLL